MAEGVAAGVGEQGPTKGVMAAAAVARRSKATNSSQSRVVAGDKAMDTGTGTAGAKDKTQGQATARAEAAGKGKKGVAAAEGVLKAEAVGEDVAQLEGMGADKVMGKPLRATTPPTATTLAKC